jgi:hypothetical protein
MTEGDTFPRPATRFNVLFLAAAFMGFYGAFMQLYAVHLSAIRHGATSWQSGVSVAR